MQSCGNWLIGVHYNRQYRFKLALMNEEQIDRFLLSFKANLQKKILQLFAISIITFFAVLVMVKLFIVYHNLGVRNESEATYLQRVGREMVLNQELQINTMFLFLQSTRKLAETKNFPMNTMSSCSQDLFDCQHSSSSAKYQDMTAFFPLISANHDLLTFSQPLANIFIYANAAPTTTVYFKNNQHDYQQQSLNYSIISQFVKSNSIFYSSAENYNKHLLAQAPTQINSFYRFVCSAITIQSNIYVLCLLSIKNKTGTIDQGKNNIFFTTTTFTKLSNGIANYRITDWINNHSLTIPNTQTVLACICSRTEKIAIQSEFNTYQGQGQICKESTSAIVDIFGPYFTYIHFTLNFSIIQASMLYSQVVQPQQVRIQYYISSNNTYSQDIVMIISKNINQLRYIGYGLVLIIGVSLLLIKYPDELVENNIISSILEIHNLYQHLRSKEQKEFTAIYARNKTTVFSFIAGYLNKYMWIYKLIKSNKEKARYKKLLREGIELFGPQDFTVKRYIFKELIRLEKKLIDSLLKVRQLPIKKKETHKLDFQLPQAKLMHHDKSMGPKRRKANPKLLNLDDDQVMKNISVSLKPNRGVRFSNDIQTVEIDRGPMFRKSRMALIEARSCETIKNDLSEADLDSVKPGDAKDSMKSLKDDEESYKSLEEINRSRKKESSLRSRGLESIYADIQNMRLDQEESEVKQILQEQNLEQKELFTMSRERQTFAEEISSTYHRTIQHYENLIKLKSQQAKNQRLDELLASVNTIYEYTLEKYQLIAKMLAFENQMVFTVDEQQREQISKFEDLVSLQRDYMALIKHQLLQAGEIIRMQIHQHLYLPVSFRNLQFLTRSQQMKVRVVARRLLAEMSEKLSPHLDSVLMRNIFSLLQTQKTSCSEKRNLLVLLTRTLQRYYATFTEQIGELKLARQFYNKKNKKIYFIVSILNPKPFAKFIDRLYEYIQPFDIVSVFNLEQEYLQNNEADISEPIISKAKVKKNSTERVKFELNEQDFSELFNFVQDRMKEIQDNRHGSSSKTISKKKVYQKEFYEILSCIQADDTEFSKYLFVLLGEEHSSYFNQTEDSSSSSNHRPQQQKIHQEITKIIDKGYYHILMAGYQLSMYSSKYGKLKKYLKMSPQLLQIELSDKEQEQNYQILQKYLK